MFSHITTFSQITFIRFFKIRGSRKKKIDTDCNLIRQVTHINILKIEVIHVYKVQTIQKIMKKKVRNKKKIFLFPQVPFPVPFFLDNNCKLFLLYYSQVFLGAQKCVFIYFYLCMIFIVYIYDINRNHSTQCVLHLAFFPYLYLGDVFTQ